MEDSRCVQPCLRGVATKDAGTVVSLASLAPREGKKGPHSLG